MVHRISSQCDNSAMVRWITKSRLSTALAIVFFLLVFFVSSVIVVRAALFDATWAGGAPDHGNLLPVITGFISAIGTVSTVILAWRADRRSAKESNLKMIQMQQQIAELQLKLNSSKDGMTS